MTLIRSVSPPVEEDDCWYDARDLLRSMLERGGMSHDDVLSVTDRIESRRDLSAAVAATQRAFALGISIPFLRSLC